MSKIVKKFEQFSQDDDDRYMVWEILSLKNKETGEIIQSFSEGDIPSGYSSDSIYEIYEVKRTTDGELFKVGDRIIFKWDTKREPFMTITDFWVNDIQLRIDDGNFGIPFTDDFKHWS